MPQTVLGIFQNRINAEDAIQDLESLDYNPKDISIIMKNQEEAHEIAHDTGATVVDGAVSGAVTGGVVGGIAGLLIGIGAITIPGIGALLIGGPIAATLGLTGAAATTTSGAVTGALAGGLIGVLMNLGVSRNDAEVYEKNIREGAILIAVPSQARTSQEVEEILADNGADQIRTIDARSEYEAEHVARRRDYPMHTYAGLKGGRRRRSAEDRVDYND